MIKISSPLGLYASALYQSTDHHRFYLRGVNIEPHPSGVGVLMVATDGHRLSAYYDRQGEAVEPVVVPVPKPLIAAIAKRSAAASRLTWDAGRWTVLDEYGDVSSIHLADAIDGSFPDWRHVVGTGLASLSLDGIGFDPALFAAMASIIKVAKAHGVDAGGVKIAPSDSSPARLLIGGMPDWSGVMMPYRWREPNASGVEPPDWLGEPDRASAAL